MTAHDGVRVRLAPGPRVIGVVSEMFTIPRPPEWQESALCAQTFPDEFFPEKGGSTAAAKAICRSCPVVDACLEDALDRQEKFGIWGAKSERERSKLLRDRRAEDDGELRCRICGHFFHGRPHQLDCSTDCRLESRRRREGRRSA